MTNISKLCAIILLSSALVAGCWYTSTADREPSVLSLRGGQTTPSSVGRTSPGTLSSHRRQVQNHPRERKLQRLFTSVLNSLIAIVTPAISEKVQYVVTRYYNYYDFDVNLDYETKSQFLGDVTWKTANTEDNEDKVETLSNWNATKNATTNAPFASSSRGSGDSASTLLTTSSFPSSYCEEEAHVDYKIRSLEGVGGITIDEISFVKGSQDIGLTFDNFRTGATWSGQWLIQTTFPTLTAATTATMTPSDASDCSRGESDTLPSVSSVEAQSVNGTIQFTDVTTEATVTVHGATERVILFASTSEISSAAVKGFSYNYATVDASEAGLLVDGAEQPIELASFFLEGGDSNLQTYMESLILEALQAEIDWILPRPLIT